ncbi:MAG: DOMON domain-containing protein [Saprospiraceae bacterium]
MKNFAFGVVWLLTALGCLSVSAPTAADNQFVIEGMHVEWAFEGDLLTFKLHSPYQGWVSLGFNQHNDWVNSHLVMGAVDANGPIMEEFYVLGYGNFPEIAALGGQKAVEEYVGLEDMQGTSFEFTLRTAVDDGFHYNLQEGQTVWLICAYSMEDDFGHHSIMRRHLQITL